MYSKVYYLIDVSAKGMRDKEYHSYYGKNKNEIPIGRADNIAWYIKEYGFDTAYEAHKEIKKLAKWYENVKLKYTGMQVTETKVTFSSYEEYLQVKPNK